jgi:cytidyltransferase-like protein
MTIRKAHTVAASTYRKTAQKKILDHAGWSALAPKPVVLTKGTFDILHAGHLALFSYCAYKARECGADAMVAVVVETDESVRARKGKNRPYQAQSERALQIALLENVDVVLLAAKSELPDVVRAVRPRVYVKGMDTAGTEQSSETQNLVIDVDVTRNLERSDMDEACDFIVFTDDGSVSTSSLVKRILESK